MGLTRRIIPCLDLKDGRVVKGVNFEGLRDAGDPVELARTYNEQGADEVVFLDIAASKNNRQTMVDVIGRAADMVDVIGRAADQLFLPLTVGGGIRTVKDIQEILRAGADKVSLNTAAVKTPENSLATSALCLQRMCAEITRCVTVLRPFTLRTAVPAGMRLSSTAAVTQLVWMPFCGHRMRFAAVRARFS